MVWDRRIIVIESNGFNSAQDSLPEGTRKTSRGNQRQMGRDDGNDQRRLNKQLATTKEYLGDAAEFDIEGQSLGRYLDN